MTAGTVLRVGLAAGRLCQHGSHRHSAVIGKDTRLSGYMLEPALTAGLASWIPYLLPAWLASLLWHRSIRDERRCRAKYGELWERYTQRARFSMLPFIH